MTPNLNRIEQRLREDGWEAGEIEAYTDNFASDWYDEKKDRELEDRYMEKGEQQWNTKK